MFIRHETLERNAFLFLLFTVIVIAIGGLVEVIPLFTIETTVEHVKGVRPYSPLEARGRDICVTRSNDTGITRSPPRACTIIRSSGAPNALAPIWRALAANTPTTGTTRI
jgi:hypothetical protein